MPSLIAHLSSQEKRQLLDDVNYLNMREFRSFCESHAIPYAIWIETADGGRKKTRDTDRKSVVLDRIRHYLKTGLVLDATCFAASIVRLGGPPQRLRPTDRLYYGWYDKKHRAMNALLRRLTGGKFRDGAIARLLARDFWMAGKAPTFAAFAKAWLEFDAKGLGPHPEAAWLTDRAKNEAGSNWKAKREKIAKRVLRTLRAIPPRQMLTG